MLNLNVAFDSGNLGRGQKLFVEIPTKCYKTPAERNVDTTRSYSLKINLVCKLKEEPKLQKPVFKNFRV